MPTIFKVAEEGHYFYVLMVIKSGDGKATAGAMWKHPSASTGLPQEVMSAEANYLNNANEEVV